MQNLCSVSIVKRGATIITHFWVIPQFTFFPLSSKKIKYKNIKNLSKKYNSEKRMSECSENSQNLVEKV
jgi:hypothetical protein